MPILTFPSSNKRRLSTRNFSSNDNPAQQILIQDSGQLREILVGSGQQRQGIRGYFPGGGCRWYLDDAGAGRRSG